MAATPGGRTLVGASYLLGGCAVALLFPATPDEISRIRDVRASLDGAPYPFFWPPGNMLAILANPAFHLGLPSELHAVRLFNLALSAGPVLALVARCDKPGLLVGSIAIFPYAWLVTATASQQGLMLGLLIALVCSASSGRNVALFLAAAGLYLVNPALVVVVPAAFALVALLQHGLGHGCARGTGRQARVAAAAYLPMAALVAIAWAATGDLMPTLSSNGALNLWLGNNPDPLAHRGVGSGNPDAGYLDAVLAYARGEPWAFATNMARKLALYWAPWDHLRSGMGGGLQPLVFAYIAVAQAVIYVTVFRLRNVARPDALALALALAVMAWLLYAAFFVKVRFRVPFDLLLFASCMLPARADAGAAAEPAERP